MSLQDNKSTVCRFVEQVENQHDLAAIDDLLSTDFVDHSGLSNPPNRDGAKMFFSAIFNAYPDVRFTIRQQLAEGDQVVTYKTFEGTHQGDFMGIPPTGKQVKIDLIDIFTVNEGKITAHWTVVDMLGMMQQIGVVPGPA